MTEDQLQREIARIESYNQSIAICGHASVCCAATSASLLCTLTAGSGLLKIAVIIWAGFFFFRIKPQIDAALDRLQKERAAI